MFDRESLTKRALEAGWPFVAGLMDEVRGALAAPAEGGGDSGAVPRAVYYASLRTLRALESLVRRMLYLMSLELDISWTAPGPRETERNRVKRTETPCNALKQDETACNARARPAPRRIALADTLTLYFPPLEPPEAQAATYGARPSIWMLGMPRAPEPAGPPETLDPAPLLARLERLTTSCADPAAEARRMALWQARRRAALQAGKRGRTHPLRTGRPPGYVKHRRGCDPLQQKLWDFWQFCHWADQAAYRPPGRAEDGLAPA
jgi:hypothetical protein